MSLYLNSSGKDSIRNAFLKGSTGVSEILLASPFFSYDSLVFELSNKCSLIRLIVRLGPATPPDKLKAVLSNKRVQVRYFTSSRFHSKLYIFGDNVALVGSANLTEAGTQSNREICIEVPKEDENFDKLVSLYQSYWEDSEVLNQDKLEKYSKLYNRGKFTEEAFKFETELKQEFGDISPGSGVEVGKTKQTKEKVFLKSYEQTYQEFLGAYRIVEETYLSDGRRKQPDSIIPLRIEIDQFLNFVRINHAVSDSYKFQPNLTEIADLKKSITALLEDWFGRDYPDLNDKVPKAFATITGILSSESMVELASIEDLFMAFDTCYSFHDRLRFYKEGHDTLKATFITENSIDRIRRFLSYLLFGKDNFIVRMGTCIFDKRYSLRHVGRSVVQEILGWVNGENIPICNSRTVKALRYMGFKVKVFSE